MMFGHMIGQTILRAIEGYRPVGEAGDEFEQIGVFDSGGRSFAPGEGRVAGNKHARNGQWIDENSRRE
jgi:hypothetical protein